MGISLGALSLDPIVASDLAQGCADRSVNAERIFVHIGAWRRSYDGVAAPFLLTGLYAATLAAVVDGEGSSFFCLDEPDGGQVIPASPGRVRVQLNGGEDHEVSGFEVLNATFQAITELAEFLALNGYPEGSAILLNEISRGFTPSRA